MTPAHRPGLILCLAIVYLVGGSSYLATRIGVTHLPPLLFGGIGFTGAGILLLIVAVRCGFRPARMRGEWLHVAGLGVVGTYGFVNPAIATLLGSLVLNEVLGGMQLLGSAVVLAGVLLVNWPINAPI